MYMYDRPAHQHTSTRQHQRHPHSGHATQMRQQCVNVSRCSLSARARGRIFISRAWSPRSHVSRCALFDRTAV